LSLPPYLSGAPDRSGTLLRVKVVPGASRSGLAGEHGDCWKVRVAAPPEKGRANAELVAVVAASLGLRRADVTVVRGATQPRKTLHVAGLSPAEVAARLTAHA
jgi:uncharacterized protein (TIGR00251 family)